MFLPVVAAALVLLSIGLYLAFFVAPIEAVMGFAQKIFYFHVPVAWVTFLSVILGAAFSIKYLLGRSEGSDRVARSAVEIAAVFGAMVLVTGPLWAYKAWGTPWVWDVRLTTFLVLELVLLSYLLIRAYAGPEGRKVAPGIAIFGVAQLPLVYFSVDLWRGPHPRVVTSGGLQPEMLAALVVCTLGFMLLYFALLRLRVEQLRCEHLVDDLHLLVEDMEMNS